MEARTTAAFTITMMAALLLLVNISSAAARDVQVADHERGTDVQEQADNSYEHDFNAVVSYDEVKQTLSFGFTLASGAMTFQGTSFVGHRDSRGFPARFGGQLSAKVLLTLGRPRLFTFDTERITPFTYLFHLTSNDGDLAFTGTFPALFGRPDLGSGNGIGLWVPAS